MGGAMASGVSLRLARVFRIRDRTRVPEKVFFGVAFIVTHRIQL